MDKRTNERAHGGREGVRKERTHGGREEGRMEGDTVYYKLCVYAVCLFPSVWSLPPPPRAKTIYPVLGPMMS